MGADLVIEGSSFYEYFYNDHIGDDKVVVSIYDYFGDIPNYYIYKENEIKDMIESIIENLQKGFGSIMGWGFDIPDTEDTKAMREYLIDLFM